MKLSQLTINPNNPRLIKDGKFKKLVHSIKQDEKFTAEMMKLRPIVIDDQNMILAGNMRYRAFQELGWSDIPDEWVKLASEMTEEQRQRFIVEDNMAFGETDFDMLANNFKVEDLLEWGFDENELQLTTDEKDNKVPETPTQTDIIIGDMFKLGDHVLICGDSRDFTTYERLMGSEKAKLVFTSPPYNLGGGMYQSYKDNLQSEEYINFNLEIIKNCQAILEGFLFWNISYNKNSRWEFIEIFYKIIKETGLKFLELICWDKGHGIPITSKEMLTRQYEDILLVGDEGSVRQDLDYYFCGINKTAYFNKKTNRGITNYWRIGTNKTQVSENKACFPVELPLKAIELMSNRGDIVIDPFGGSGSTMIACEKAGRKCRLIELDPILCQLTINRYEEYTGNKAEKI